MGKLIGAKTFYKDITFISNKGFKETPGYRESKHMLNII